MAFSRGPSIVTDGLVLALDAANHKSYPGSGTVWRDLSGNSNNGTLVNSPIFSSDKEGILSFNGTDEYVSINDASSIDITGAITMEILFKAPNDVNIERLIIKDVSGGTYGYGYQFARYNNGKMLATYNNGTTRIFLYSNDLGTGFASNYIHTMYCYDGSNSQKIWVNGVDETGTVTSFTSGFTGGSTSGTPLYLMRRGGEYAESDTAFVRIYNRGLSEQEAQQNYNATKSRFGL
jgi:hypothetical protein